MEGNLSNRTVHHLDVAYSLPPIVAVLGATQSALAPIKHRYSFPRIAVSRIHESACMRLDRRVHVAHQIRISRSSPTDVPEELREPGPGVDLDQDFRQLHPWQELKRARESYDSVGCWKDEPLGAQPLTSEAKENLRSIHRAQGPVRACQASSSSKSRDRSIEKPRCSRTSVKCCRRVCSRRA